FIQCKHAAFWVPSLSLAMVWPLERPSRKTSTSWQSTSEFTGNSGFREHQWLCQHILESVGEDDLWRIFVRLKDIPAEHLCTAEVRMCSRRLKDDKCLSEANCKGSGQSEGKMSSVGCALQNIELCEFDV
ncbi:unnamed protein product, partial [Durusdinium trenchii]